MRASVCGACLALLGLLGCGHVSLGAAHDVDAVTELAARYALDHDVPAVLREASPICLTVDGQAPSPAVLARLSEGPVRVSSGVSACAGPRAVVLEVSAVVVSGETASARAGVRLGPTGLLEFRRVDGVWRVLHSPPHAGASQGLVLP